MTDTRTIITEDVLTGNEEDLLLVGSEAIAVEEDERHSWSWSDQVRLVELVELHSKNWANILKLLHQEHLCTDISDSKKLRVKFTSINAPTSAFRKQFKKTKFSAPSKHPETGKKLTKAEVKVLESDHNAAEEQRRKDHAATLTRLDKIQREEIKASKGRGKKRTIDEVQGTLTSKEAERRAKKVARIESARKEATLDRERQTLLMELLRETVQTLKSTNGLITRLQSDIYPTQPFKPQNHNNGGLDSCNDM